MSMRSWWRHWQEERQHRMALALMRELGREFGRKRPIEVTEPSKLTAPPQPARLPHPRCDPDDLATAMDYHAGAEFDGW